jgi:hypothetical protein
MRTRLKMRVRCHWCGKLVPSVQQAKTAEVLMRIFAGIADSVETCPECDRASTFSRKDYYVVQIPYADEARRSVADPGGHRGSGRDLSPV